MKFILREIKLWFNDEDTDPKSYIFLPNKINVVTGDSSTGKTSFWNIVDYCLMSNVLNIANSINDSVSWYGIKFEINGKQIAIARKSPFKGSISEKVFFAFGELPPAPTDNSRIPDIKAQLDVEFGVSDKLKYPYGKELGKVSFNLSYRHFLLFVSLTEDIIGQSKVYFDTPAFGKDEYDKILPHVFDLVIGINNMKSIKDKELLLSIDKEIKKLSNKEKNRLKEYKNQEKDTYLIIDKLKKNNFIEHDLVVESIDAADFLINDVISNTQKTADTTQLFIEIDSLKKRQAEIKVQLFAIEKYRKEYNSYKNGLEKTADSLKPIEYLKNNLSDQLLTSYETKFFIDSIENSFRDIKDSLAKQKDEPLSISGDANELIAELKKVEGDIDKLNQIRTNFQAEGLRFIVLGEIKNMYEQIKRRVVIEPVDNTKLLDLSEQKSYSDMNIRDIEQDRFSMKSLLNDHIQRNYEVLQLQPYKNSRVSFNESQMVLQIRRENELFPLDNVGSKSNHMLMHLCFYLGLHEHMITIGQEHVPQFLFIDQPSIPYYNGDEFINDDKTKLVDAFSLLNSFMDYIISVKKEDFQILLVEHAPKEYWIENMLDYFHTVEEFFNGKKLIPNDIFRN